VAAVDGEMVVPEAVIDFDMNAAAAADVGEMIRSAVADFDTVPAAAGVGLIVRSAVAVSTIAAGSAVALGETVTAASLVFVMNPADAATLGVMAVSAVA